MKERIGSCYEVDHGGGRRSLKLVVGLDRSTARRKRVWIVASIRDEGTEVQRYDELTLAYWDRIDADHSLGNVRRVS